LSDVITGKENVNSAELSNDGSANGVSGRVKMEFVHIDDPSVSEELRQMCRENSKRLRDGEATVYASPLSRPKILDEIYSKM